MRAIGLPFEITKWLEKEVKTIGICNNVVQAFNEGTPAKIEEIKVAYEFMKEFKEKLIATKTNKRFIRMIEEKTLAFGPKRKGPNILLSKFIDKE